MTPYGHPIVPLLLDFHAAREAVPACALPHHAAVSGRCRARAAWHVEQGLARIHRAHSACARRAAGPSEGAISAATLELLDRSGFQAGPRPAPTCCAPVWRAASAEEANDPRAYNRPYALPGSGMHCFFRDDALSDRIGFTYATWHGDDAARNFAAELAQLAQRYAGEHGARRAHRARWRERLGALSRSTAITSCARCTRSSPSIPPLELTTLSECVARGLQPVPLPQVVAGSWVHGTLATWMGDPDKNAAWDLLCEAKLAFDRVMRRGLAGTKHSAPPRNSSWRCARARTGSGGLAITTRPTR